MSAEETIPPAVEEPKADTSPIYPLIEFHEGIDPEDFYCEVRIGMVLAHVFTLVDVF